MALMMGRHFSISDRRQVASVCGIFWSCGGITSMMAALIFAMIGAGVFFRTQIPCQTERWKLLAQRIFLRGGSRASESGNRWCKEYQLFHLEGPY
jgi:hypothetical protein